MKMLKFLLTMCSAVSAGTLLAAGVALDEAAGAADVEDAVRSIEDSASNIQPEMNFSLDLGPAEEPEAEVSLESTQPFTV
jgi:hypothetical protein